MPRSRGGNRLGQIGLSGGGDEAAGGAGLRGHVGGVGLHLRRARAGPVSHPGADVDRGPTTPPRGKFLPKPTNPNLPVLGDAIWVSGGRLPVTIRFAVHAVRRIEGATVLDWSVTPLRATGFRVRRRPARHRPGALPRLPQRRQHRPARPLVGPGVPTAEPRVAAAVQPLPVHPTVGHPAGSAHRGDPADADRVPRTARHLGVRRRQPGHAGPVRPRPGEPGRHRAGRSAAHQPGAISRPSGRRHHTDRVPLRRRADAPAEHPDRSGRRGPRPNIRAVDPAVGLGPEHLPAPAVRAAGLQPTARRCLRAEQQPGERPSDQPDHSAAAASGWSTLWVVTEVYRPAGVRVPVHRAGSVVLRPPGRGRRRPAHRQLPGTPVRHPRGRHRAAGFRHLSARCRWSPRRTRRRPCCGPIDADTGQWSYLVEDPPRGWSTADWPTDLPDPAQLAEYQSIVERVSALPPG